MRHKFVDVIPDDLEDGVLYVSMEFCTVIHRCACGCGNQVVTPISPTGWQITFDGEGVSLYPSIGNWSFDCQSHYWINGGRVEWAPKWTKEQIERGRRRDRAIKDEYFDTPVAENDIAISPTRVMDRLLRWFRDLID